MLVYLDSSAILKLILGEPERPALVDWLVARPRRVTSSIAAVEVGRAVRRYAPTDPGTWATASVAIRALDLLNLDPATLSHAMQLEPRVLRSLDAIHLASALSLRDELEAVVTYDRRLADACVWHGLAVVAPA